jgi:hypothetical protein
MPTGHGLRQAGTICPDFVFSTCLHPLFEGEGVAAHWLYKEGGK